MVVVLAGPGGVGGIAVGQQAGQAQLVAVAVDGPLARRGRVAAGGERRPARAFRAQVGETQVVLLGGVQVELEQAGLLVLGAVGQALGVDRVVGGRQRQVVGQLHVAAVATVEIEQGIDAAVFAATEHGAGVDLLLVVGVIAVLEHGADVAAFAQQVRRVLGLHVHGAAEAAIAGEHRVRSLLHLDALDHFRFDEHGALLVALEAALLRAVQGIGHVLGVAQAPDVGGLSARLGRAAHGHSGQGLQQAGDVVRLLAFDIPPGQGRTADVAGVHFATVADDGLRVQLQRVVAVGVDLAPAHHVAAARLHQLQLGTDQQPLQRLAHPVAAAQRRSAQAPQERLVEQHLDLRLLRQARQRGGQRLRRQVEASFGSAGAGGPQRGAEHGGGTQRAPGGAGERQGHAGTLPK